ncbi:MAG: hypothetical protein LHW51_09000 [Candidatus Cloacimonetes bacterium]|nr:hypothetical protein [Candidatus Cloacimonadota bacterium]MCK9243059.1 hypothetical protein [Candidatus Cloacimonadota bacterium]
MTSDDCLKNAVYANGESNLPHQRIYNVGIEDLRIVREKGDDFSNDQVYDHVLNDDHTYFGNNISIRNAANCWVKGVESENTFRNHIALHDAEHVTISGVYFHEANKNCDGGFGYGVGLWDSSKNLVENSIFRLIRHAITIVDGSWYNVIAYNYAREERSVLYNGTKVKWSDIAIHGESTNTYFHNFPSPEYEYDPNRKPYYNLIEGNNLDYLCVDATHRYNGTHNSFLRNRVTQQIHVQGSGGTNQALLGCAIDVLVVATFPPPLAAAWILSTINMFSRVCAHCIAFQANDLRPNVDNFRDQPRQLFINNYARECNWWKSQVLDYPIRMHSEISQFQANTRKHYATWWGGTQKRTLRPDSDFDDINSCYSFASGSQTKPDFWPDLITWPYQYKDDQNPAQQRWHLGGKYTVGSGDSTSFVGVTRVTVDTLFEGDIEIEPGALLIVDPGVTVSMKPGKKIKINGSLIAKGTEAGPITFTCSDPTNYWQGIEVRQKKNKPLPSIELNNCIVSRANKRAILLDNYSEARIDSCQFVDNHDNGALSSQNGNLHISNSLFYDNDICSYNLEWPKGGALFLKNSDVHISNTSFTSNIIKTFGTGAIHIERDTGDENRNIEFFNCYFSENTSETTIIMGSLAILSEGYEGALGIYNCSFINQPREIFSTLKNDVQITNGLFWNSSGIPHFIKSDNTNSSYTFKISKSFIPNFEQSPITMMSNYTVVDTIYSGETMLQLDTERNLYLPGVLSPLVNAGNDDIRMLENFVATDLLGNPRYCGSGIDIGAIEVMKPEISIGDSLIGFDEDILIDFGNVPVFEEVVQHLRIANIGTMPLILSDPVFPEGYMAGSNISFPYTIETAYVETTIPIDIDEGDFEPEMEAFVDIPIVFHPTLHTIDYMNKFISFSTNDSLNSSVSISVNGVGLAAELSISDSTLVMADFPANNTPSFGRDFLIFKNTGNIGLVIDTLKVSHSDNSLAFFEYAATSDTPEENKQSGGTSFEKDMRGAKAQSAVPQSRSKQITDRRGSGLQRSLMLKREPSKGLSDLTWYGAEHNHIIELAPGDSIFVHTRYIPFLIGADSTKINVRSNDAYKADRTISLFGEGIPLVVTDNPTETQVSNVIMADTLWSCPQIEVKSSVQVSPQARLTIRPYKDAVSVQSDSTCCFNVSGELHARKSLNQLFSISFAGVDSLAGWKGLVFKNNDSGISRLDSLIIINANDHSRLEEGGGAIHSYEYCSILLSNVTIETSNSLHDGGAIYVNNGEVQIHECTISNSTALNGGAIAAMGAGSEVLISESTFDGNAAEQLGGVLYANNATISINAAQISDNSATSGGVMYLENADLNFMDSACSGNTAVYGGVVSTSGDLGNIIISSSEFNKNGDSSCYGGSIYHAGGQLTINNGSSFSQNAGLCGGAIALEGLSALLTVSNAVFDENTAITHGGAITSNGGSVGVENSSFDDCSVEAGLGGAIALFESDYLISGNRFTHCLTDSVSGKGGSIYIENTPAQKSKGQTKFATNQRELSSNEIKQSNAYAGGAIYQNGSGDIISNAIFQNTASQGAGLYLKSIVGRFENNTIADNNASVMGWAMVCDSLAVTIKNTIIWRDTLAYISPIHCINAQDIDLINCAIMDTLDVASGTYASVSTYNCVTDNPEFVSADIENYQLGNTSRCVNAGTKDSALDGVDAMGNPRINANNGTPIIDMGAYEFVEPYWVCTRDTIPDYVEITYSPTHFFNDLQVTNTGTLHVDPGVSLLAQNNSMIMVSGSIEALGTENSGIVFSTTPGNDAWYGFSFKGEPSMGSSAFTHCAFLNGKAYPDGSHSGSDASNGGLMYIDGYPSIQIDYCSFSVNQALDNGGALYLTNLSPQDSLQITNSTFSGNRVKNGTGGAVCSMDSKLHLLNNSFGSNSAGYPLDTNVIPEAIYDFCGGAVSLIKSKTVDIEHSISNNQFLANYAAGTGGGIYAQAGEQRIVGNQFIDSIALGADKSGICSDLRGGGAIGVVGGSISEISQNTFDSNYAYAGGAILNNGSVSNVADNTFTENKAQFGGAIQLINIDVENNLMRNLFTANGTADSTNCVIGGAIRVLDCSDNVEISLSKFSRNSSSEKGGAIAIQNSDGHILTELYHSENLHTCHIST